MAIGSIVDSADLSAPGGKGECPFIAQGLNGKDLSGVDRLGKFVIEDAIVEARCRRVITGRGKHDLGHPSPIDRRQAQGTRFAACVDHAVVQGKVVALLTGVSNRDDFGVGRGVICGGHQIGSSSDDFVLIDHHRAKRTSAVRLYIFDGQANGFPQVFLSSFVERHD